MKRNILTAARFFAATLLLVLVGTQCMQDEFEGRIPVFTGEIVGQDGSTKTLLDDSWKVNWVEGDQVAINGVTYKAIPQSDAKKASFTKESGDDPTSPYTAYYPASIYNGGTPTLPATQTYESGKISNVPMCAYNQSSTSLKFYNICGVVQLTLKGTQTVKKIEVTETSSDKKAICGDFEVESNVAKIKNTVEAASHNKITLDCGSGVALNSTDGVKFWIAIPAGTYTLNFKVIGESEGQYYEKTTTDGAAEVQASNIYTFVWEDKIKSEVTITNPTEDGCSFTVKQGDTSISNGDMVEPGQTITLAASPKDGYMLDKWTVAKTDAPTTTVTVTDNAFMMPDYPVTISASFKPASYSLSEGAHENGTIVITDGSGSITSADFGATVTITATASEGYKFSAWELTGVTLEDAKKSTSPTTFTMPAKNVTVGATFVKESYTVKAGTHTNGHITIAGGSQDADATAEYQSSVSLSATAETGYDFLSWDIYKTDETGTKVTLSSAATTNSNSFTMPAYGVTVDATFTQHNYTLTKNSATGGSYTAKIGDTEASTGHYNETVSLKATAETGYAFDKWTVTGASVASETAAETTFTIGTSDVAITPSFKLIDYDITKTATPEGYGSVETQKNSTDADKANYNDEITVVPTANDTYELDKVEWKAESATGYTDITTDKKFTMPAEKVEVKATFKKMSYTVTWTAPSTGGSVKVEDGTTQISTGTKVQWDNTVKVTATPNNGYTIKTISWTEGSTKTYITPSSGTSATFTMPTSDVTVTVEFAPATGTQMDDGGLL